MTNPISQIPNAPLPPISQQIVAADGLATSQFYRFLLGLWSRTGGALGVNTSDTVQVATQALQTANTASQQSQTTSAGLAVVQLEIATLSNELATVSNTASSASTTANNNQSLMLLKVANLNDVGSKAAARLNLGVGTYPAVYSFDTLPVGLRRGIPLIFPVATSANLAGTQVWWDVAPTSDAVFHVSSKNLGAIGTITIAAAGTGVVFSLQAAVVLTVGDTLIVTCPSPVDGSLSRVGITIPLTLL